MSLTLAVRLEKTKVMANIVIPLVEIPDQLLIANIERSRDQVWRALVPIREPIFRTTATLATDDLLPSDYVSYANNATYVVSATTYPFKFVNIQEIGSIKKNPFDQCTATAPGLWFSDGRLRTFPIGLTGITFEYVKRPTGFFGAVPPYSETDSLPEDSEAQIVRGAFERTLQNITDEQSGLKLSQAQLQSVGQATERYYNGFFAGQLQKVGLL